MKPTGDIRLFIALYPPAAIQQQMLDLLAPLTLPEHRVTPLTQVHLTLLFIGERRPREVRDLRESIERSASGLPPFTLAPRRLITIPDHPPAAPPRLLALETDAPPPLLELQRRLATRLAHTSQPRGGRPDRFIPHITLCRYAHGVASAPIPASAVEGVSIVEPFEVRDVVLVSSVLTRSGGVHQPVAVTPLA